MFFASFPLKFSGRNVLIRSVRSADLLILPAWSRFTPCCVCVQLRLFQDIFVSLKAIFKKKPCSRTTFGVTSPSNYWLTFSSITRALVELTRLYFFSFLAGVRHVSGINIYTAKEQEVVNGTSVRLKCTFTSTQPVSLQSATVSWSFRPLNSRQDESVCTGFLCNPSHVL